MPASLRSVRNIPVEEYLQPCPWKAVQIHMAGVRRNEKSRLYDAHQPLQGDDYRLPEWTLARSNPAWLTRILSGRQTCFAFPIKPVIPLPVNRVVSSPAPMFIRCGKMTPSVHKEIQPVNIDLAFFIRKHAS